MEIICPICKAKNEITYRFCINCGALLKKPQPTKKTTSFDLFFALLLDFLFLSIIIEIARSIFANNTQNVIPFTMEHFILTYFLDQQINTSSIIFNHLILFFAAVSYSVLFKTLFSGKTLAESVIQLTIKEKTETETSQRELRKNKIIHSILWGTAFYFDIILFLFPSIILLFWYHLSMKEENAYHRFPDLIAS